MVSASNTDSFLEVSQISLFTAGLYYCNIAHVKNPLTVWNQRRIGDFPSCLGKVNGYAPLLTEGKHWHITHQEMFIPRQGDPKLPLRINECRYMHSIRGKKYCFICFVCCVFGVLCLLSAINFLRLSILRGHFKPHSVSDCSAYEDRIWNSRLTLKRDPFMASSSCSTIQGMIRYGRP